MRTTRFLLLLALPMLALAGCGKDGTEPQTPGTNDTGAIKFEIGFAGQDGTQIRVATGADFNSEWEDGDKIGIFAVESGQTLAASDNPIHNVPLTYDKTAGTWSGEAYWPDGVDMLDFYACYPYSAEATDPTALAFAVSDDQSDTTDGKSNYNLSDMLLGASTNGGDGWAEGEIVNLTFSHALALVQLAIDESADGIDFDKDVTVTLQGVQTAAGVNLATGAATASGNNTGNVVMHPAAMDGTTRLYRALVPAQIVASGTKLFRIDNDGQTLTSYALTDNLLLAPANAYKFTLSGTAPTTQTITPAPITGLTFPAMGGVPDTSADETEQYEVESIVWKTGGGDFDGSAFAATTIYYADITLTAKSGWQFAIEDGEYAETIDIVLAWVDYLDDFFSRGSLMAFTVIGQYTEAPLTSVTLRATFHATAAPSGDTTPPTVVSTTPAGGSQDAPTSGEIVVTFSEEMNPAFGKVAYTKGGYDIYHPLSGGVWSEGNTVYTVAYSGLEPGTQYMFPVYEFQDMAGNEITMEAPYIKTAVVPDIPITAAPITGIVKPVTGATPSTAIDGGTGYTAEITRWFEGMNAVGGNFESEKVYTAMVRLTVAEGYSLDGFTADDAQDFMPADAASIRVDGSIENPLYLVITYPATAAQADPIKITPCEITGIDSPVTGQSPDYTADFTGNEFAVTEITWSAGYYIGSNYTFTAGTVYYLYVDMEAKEGYTFKGMTETEILSFSVGGTKAAEISNRPPDGKKLRIQVQFPATQ